MSVTVPKSVGWVRRAQWLADAPNRAHADGEEKWRFVLRGRCAGIGLLRMGVKRVMAVVMAVVSGGSPGAAEAGHGCLGGVLGPLG
jgi:hypothetical protein